MTTSDAAGGVTFAECVNDLRSGAATAREAAGSLIAQMNDNELLWLLDGDTPARAMLRLPARMKAGPIAGGAVPRLGIPGIRFSDGPRGVVIGRSTAFPVTIMRAATWDPALEERVGQRLGERHRQRLELDLFGEHEIEVLRVALVPGRERQPEAHLRPGREALGERERELRDPERPLERPGDVAVRDPADLAALRVPQPHRDSRRRPS